MNPWAKGAQGLPKLRKTEYGVKSHLGRYSTTCSTLTIRVLYKYHHGWVVAVAQAVDDREQAY